MATISYIYFELHYTLSAEEEVSQNRDGFPCIRGHGDGAKKGLQGSGCARKKGREKEREE